MTVCHSTKYFMQKVHKKQNLGKNCNCKVFEIFYHLTIDKYGTKYCFQPIYRTPHLGFSKLL